MGEGRGEGQKAEGREEMDRADEGSSNDPQSAMATPAVTARSIAQLRLRCIAQVAQSAPAGQSAASDCEKGIPRLRLFVRLSHLFCVCVTSCCCSSVSVALRECASIEVSSICVCCVSCGCVSATKRTKRQRRAEVEERCWHFPAPRGGRPLLPHDEGRRHTGVEGGGAEGK